MYEVVVLINIYLVSGIKIGPSVIDHSNNTASAPIRLLQNNIIAAQTSG